MAVTYEQFVDRFPPLKELGRDAIESELAAAANHHNAGVWGAQLDDGIAFYAADVLAMSKRASCCKQFLINEGTTTWFRQQWERMADALVSGDRVP